MKRFIATLMIVAAGAAAQTPDQEKIVAVINSETITRAKLDQLYNGLSAQTRAQFDRAGGKMAFLDSYVAKRLLIQEAMKSGFDKRADVQGAMEDARDEALFEKYVKDVVAAPIVTDAEARKFYDEHRSEFTVPESVKVRHIVISWNNKPKPDALDIIKRVATEIRAGAPSPRDKTPENQRILLARFNAAARRYSEDGVASAGGDLGWVARGTLDKNFEDAAFALEPMTMSGIVESQFGYHLIFVEDRKPAGTQPFDEVKAGVREYLTNQRSADVMGAVKRLTNEVRATSKVAFFPENVR